MAKMAKIYIAAILLMGTLIGLVSSPAAAAVRIEGQVQAGGGPLASSTVTLWAASAGEPRQLAQTQTGSDGHFQLGTQEAVGRRCTSFFQTSGHGHGEPP